MEQWKDEKEALLRRNQQLELKLESLTSELEGMRTRCRQEAQIRGVQSRVFEGIENDTWMSGDDSTVWAEIDKHRRLIKQWARGNASDDMNTARAISEEDKRRLIATLRNIV
ncbi:hypothetical protein OQA88_4827 [Cercophora sp. LCS_1]